MGAHRGRNWICQVGSQVVERGANCAPEPARSKPSNRFIDGNDAPNLQRLSGFLLRPILTGVGRVSQDFELRLNDLQLAVVRIFFHLAVKRDHLPGRELVLQVGGVKPQAAQPRASLPDRELEDRHASRAEQAGIPHFPNHRRHLSRSQFRNPTRIQPVFITKGKIMKQVADSVNSLAGKNLSDARTNALHILNRGGEFEHALRLRVA